MDHLSDLDRLTRTTRRRDFDDGLQDFLIGFNFLFIGLAGGLFFSQTGLEWLAWRLAWNRELTSIALLALIPLYVLILFGGRRLIARFRREKLWKGQGAIQPLRWQVSWQINLVGTVVFIGMLAAAFWLNRTGRVSETAVLRTLVAAAGTATGIVMYGLARELAIRRYLWVGVGGGLLSALLIPLPLTFGAAWLVLGTVWMALLSLSGAWALRQTLQAFEDGSRG